MSAIKAIAFYLIFFLDIYVWNLNFLKCYVYLSFSLYIFRYLSLSTVLIWVQFSFLSHLIPRWEPTFTECSSSKNILYRIFCEHIKHLSAVITVNHPALQIPKVSQCLDAIFLNWPRTMQVSCSKFILFRKSLIHWRVGYEGN